MEFSPQRPQRAQRSDFLFGGERPPNKKPRFYNPVAMKRDFEFIPEGRGFMIRSPSPDQIIRTFPQRPLRLRGKPGFSQSTFESKSPMKSIEPSLPFAYLGQKSLRMDPARAVGTLS
jgi:hypothetical protein